MCDGVQDSEGKVHDPYSYEIETWSSLEPVFPKRKRVSWSHPGNPGAPTDVRASAREDGDETSGT